jgi:hypothetical protein
MSKGGLDRHVPSVPLSAALDNVERSEGGQLLDMKRSG